jgi:TM2 domain-containing membrane protein YozV
MKSTTFAASPAPIRRGSPLESNMTQTQVAKSGGTAAVLELLGGLLIQTFGIGHLYSGHVVRGLFIMFAYWIVQGINVGLMLVAIGWITLPIVWLLTIVISPLWAASSCAAR